MVDARLAVRGLAGSLKGARKKSTSGSISATLYGGSPPAGSLICGGSWRQVFRRRRAGDAASDDAG